MDIGILYLNKYNCIMKIRRGVKTHAFSTSALAQAGGGLQDDLLIAQFSDGQSALSPEQERHLASWVTGKPLVKGKLALIVGGATKTSRSGRLRRLHALLQLLQRLGVAARCIWPDIEWSKPARMGAMEDMPADTVWLRLTDYKRARPQGI